MLPKPSVPITIHLIRHGEVLLDGPERVYGDLEMPLSRRGIQQLEALGEYLSNVRLDAVYSSDIERAKIGAASIIKFQPAPLIEASLSLQIDRGFREIFRGDWRGLTWAEIETRWPGGAARFVNESETYRDHNGETLRDVSVRAVAALERILHNSYLSQGGANEKNVAIVAHSWVVRVIVAHALGMPAAGALQIHADPGKVSTIAGGPEIINNNGWRVLQMNQGLPAARTSSAAQTPAG
ncbi:MAG: histidine phosphatase family protein [Planctomycetota bacterium]